MGGRQPPRIHESGRVEQENEFGVEYHRQQGGCPVPGCRQPGKGGVQPETIEEPVRQQGQEKGERGREKGKESREGQSRKRTRREGVRH